MPMTWLVAHLAESRQMIKANVLGVDSLTV